MDVNVEKLNFNQKHKNLNQVLMVLLTVIGGALFLTLWVTKPFIHNTSELDLRPATVLKFLSITSDTNGHKFIVTVSARAPLEILDSDDNQNYIATAILTQIEETYDRDFMGVKTVRADIYSLKVSNNFKELHIIFFVEYIDGKGDTSEVVYQVVKALYDYREEYERLVEKVIVESDEVYYFESVH